MDSYVLADGDQRMECLVPFPDELTTELQFELKKNTKIGNMLPRMTKELKKDSVRRILLYATGKNCAKCVASAEVLKSTMRDTVLHQWTELRNTKSTDVWAPAADDRLDRVFVEKFEPAVFILISRDPFPDVHHRLSQQSTLDAYPSFLKRANRPSLDATGGSRKSVCGTAPGAAAAAAKRRDNQWRRQSRQKRPRDRKLMATASATAASL